MELMEEIVIRHMGLWMILMLRSLEFNFDKFCD